MTMEVFLFADTCIGSSLIGQTDRVARPIYTYNIIIIAETSGINPFMQGKLEAGLSACT